MNHLPEKFPLISISGPLVSGKTTLINALQDELAGNFQFLNDFPREALQTLGTEIADADLRAFQNFVGLTQLQRETEVVSPTILDKSLLDALAYWNILVGSEPPVWAQYVHPERYALVFVCEHNEISAPGDFLQQKHLGIRAQIAAELDKLTHGWNNVIKVSGTPSQRLRQVFSVISEIQR